ncbi:MAG TPA: carboxypeptidase-like regulatory domain-containing protein [Vicinamibacterales bacterium]|nr:carboxypeptidase-like regulatory domain-containing protein [Vicinamibacterales bacterium]
MRAHLPVVVSTLLLMAGLATSATHAAPLPRSTPPNVLSTIQGNALDSVNGPLPNNVVRLRDARAGRIVDTQTTDRSGLFAFRSIDPGSYIVELVGNAQAILSASQILNVDAGQAVSAVVKLPFHISPLAGVLGHTVPSAAAVTSAAASSGVMAVTVAGEPISPQ